MSTIMGGGASCAFLVGSMLPLLVSHHHAIGTGSLGLTSQYIERFGRRNTMMMGSATNGACMLAVAICVALGNKYPEMHQSTGYAACAFIFLYEFTFGIGWNSMWYVMHSARFLVADFVAGSMVPRSLPSACATKARRFRTLSTG